jgi:hypothetical protein
MRVATTTTTLSAHAHPKQYPLFFLRQSFLAASASAFPSARTATAIAVQPQQLTITCPDDWH